LIDIRYHIYSLAAVFLALAIGVVIGVSFARSAPSADASDSIVRRYERDMSIVKSEIVRSTQRARFSDEMARKAEEFCTAALPILVRDRLRWRNVAIVQTGDYGELRGVVKRVCELAGAEVTNVTEINRKFPFDDAESVAEALSACGQPVPEDVSTAVDRLFQIVADTVFLGRYAHLLPKLEETGIAKFAGDYSKLNKLVVLVGGAKTNDASLARQLDARLINLFEKRGATVVGGESSAAAVSYVREWDKLGIASVDNVESAMGQVALVCALNGEKASFGIKNTAERFIPRSLEPK
jgi:hypothetical protein